MPIDSRRDPSVHLIRLSCNTDSSLHQVRGYSGTVIGHTDPNKTAVPAQMAQRLPGRVICSHPSAGAESSEPQEGHKCRIVPVGPRPGSRAAFRGCSPEPAGLNRQRQREPILNFNHLSSDYSVHDFGDLNFHTIEDDEPYMDVKSPRNVGAANQMLSGAVSRAVRAGYTLVMLGGDHR